MCLPHDCPSQPVLRGTVLRPLHVSRWTWPLCSETPPFVGGGKGRCSRILPLGVAAPMKNITKYLTKVIDFTLLSIL